MDRTVLRFLPGGGTVNKRTIARWLTGSLWFLSWFELYLEVVRHRHVALPLITPGNPALVGSLHGAHAGDWVRAVVACAWLAPLAFVIFAVSDYAGRRHSLTSRDAQPRASFPFSEAAIAFGSVLTILGLFNQVLRQPSLEIDLTLRHGNGGFIALGATLAVLGLLRRHKVAGR